MPRALACLLVATSLAGCAGTATKSGFLSAYDGLTPRTDLVRAKALARQDAQGLAGVRRVALDPAQVHPGPSTNWMTEAERTRLLREVDAQLCYEFAERYAIAAPGEAADARVRAAVVEVKGTNRAFSAVSAVGNAFIPGPVGLRAPGTLGALAAEAEMLDPAGRQLAAISWNRAGTPVGFDNPSLSRIGDALQFAGSFADATAKTLSVKDAKSPEPDAKPCARFGPRFQVGGFAAKAITGLYTPMSRGEDEPMPTEPQAAPRND